jgi:hypothetical protein
MTGPTQHSDFGAISAFRYRWLPSTRTLILRDFQYLPGIVERVSAFLWLVGIAYCAPWIASKYGVMGICLSACLALAAVACLVSVNDVVLNFSEGTYSRRCGPWPFLFCRRGSLDDIRAIEVCTETCARISKFVGSVNYQVRVVSLQWKDATIRPLCLAVGTLGRVVPRAVNLNHDAGVVEFDADVLGELTGIPVERSTPRT